MSANNGNSQKTVVWWTWYYDLYCVIYLFYYQCCVKYSACDLSLGAWTGVNGS